MNTCGHKCCLIVIIRSYCDDSSVWMQCPRARPRWSRERTAQGGSKQAAADADVGDAQAAKPSRVQGTISKKDPDEDNLAFQAAYVADLRLKVETTVGDRARRSPNADAVVPAGPERRGGTTAGAAAGLAGLGASALVPYKAGTAPSGAMDGASDLCQHSKPRDRCKPCQWLREADPASRCAHGNPARRCDECAEVHRGDAQPATDAVGEDAVMNKKRREEVESGGVCRPLAAPPPPFAARSRPRTEAIGQQ